MKKIISLILSTFLITTLLSGFSIIGEGAGSSNYVRYMPPDNYYSYSNGPSFTWPLTNGATYDIKVCNNKELTDVVQYANNLKFNVYVFPNTFLKDKTYYWSVRVNKGAWQPARRFYIDSNAYDFTLPSFTNVCDNLSEHPRFFNNEDLKGISTINKESVGFKNQKKIIDEKVNNGLYSDVVIKNESWGKNCWGYTKPANDLLQSAMMYLITNENKYLNYVINGFEKIKDLRPEDYFEWGVDSDREECVFAYKSAIAYDIAYNSMSRIQKNHAVALIERHLVRPYRNFCNNGNMSGSLYDRPFGSHNYRLNQALVAGVAIYNESSLARNLVDFHLPFFSVMTYPFAYEDGSSGQGPYYGIPIEIIPVAIYMERAGVCNILNKPYIRNTIVNHMYLWPTNWIMSVGDSYNQKPENEFQCLLSYLYISSYDKSELYKSYGKWMLNKSVDNNMQYYHDEYSDYMPFNANNNTLIKEPALMPNAMYFPDTGWIGMYSDIKDDNRVGLTFKSSYFGSYNHSHPDQNSFVLSAYGKELLIDSDYYDYYHSPFDINWNKKTYAHNAITYNNGKGQPYNDIDAKGKITGFINQNRYKLAEGDATKAYKGGLSKAKRDIIYIAPETFIVIDDLVNGNIPTNYEYFLNTRGKMELDKSKNEVKITSDDVLLDAKIHYPHNLESEYIDYFAGPDLVKINPPDIAKNATDKRVFFRTEKINKTKIVSTLDVRKNDKAKRIITSEETNDYLKLIFETGDTLYVNLTDKDEIITKDGISFMGKAVIYNKDNLMLIDGYKFAKNDITYIISDSKVSVAVSKDDVSFSSVDNNACVQIRSEKPKNVIKRHKENSTEILENKEKDGVLWYYKNGFMIYNLYPGTYDIIFSKEMIPGKAGTGIFKVITDGEEKNISYDGIYDVNNKLIKDVTLNDIKGLFRIEDFNNVSCKNMRKGGTLSVDKNLSFYLCGDNPYIKLTSIKDDSKGKEITREKREALKSATVTNEKGLSDKNISNPEYLIIAGSNNSKDNKIGLITFDIRNIDTTKDHIYLSMGFWKDVKSFTKVPDMKFKINVYGTVKDESNYTKETATYNNTLYKNIIKENVPITSFTAQDFKIYDSTKTNNPMLLVRKDIKEYIIDKKNENKESITLVFDMECENKYNEYGNKVDYLDLYFSGENMGTWDGVIETRPRLIVSEDIKKEPSITTLNDSYKFNDSYTFFGKLDSKGLAVTEYGMIIGKTKDNLLIPYADGENIRKLKALPNSVPNYFGMEVIDKNNKYESMYGRSYVKIGNDVYYGNIITIK